MEKETTYYNIRKFDYVFTPDYSMFVDVPDHINRDAVYKTRSIGAIWQQKFVLSVIPTFSFEPASSFGKDEKWARSEPRLMTKVEIKKYGELLKKADPSVKFTI